MHKKFNVVAVPTEVALEKRQYYGAHHISRCTIKAQVLRWPTTDRRIDDVIVQHPLLCPDGNYSAFFLCGTDNDWRKNCRRGCAIPIEQATALTFVENLIIIAMLCTWKKFDQLGKWKFHEGYVQCLCRAEIEYLIDLTWRKLNCRLFEAFEAWAVKIV